jgi:predicted  nucleic acid-binding Zn-ribbon protein
MKKILEIVNDKLVEYESRNEYLRSEVLRLEDENKKLTMEIEVAKADNESLMTSNSSLSGELTRQDKVISSLKKKIEELEGDSKNA